MFFIYHLQIFVFLYTFINNKYVSYYYLEDTRKKNQFNYYKHWISGY